MNQDGNLYQSSVTQREDLIKCLNKFHEEENERKYLEIIWEEEKTDQVEKENDLLKKLSTTMREDVLVQSNVKYLKNFTVPYENFSEPILRLLLHKMRHV